MATIEDVAKRAGVSRMTVSRVINNSGYIKKETRERILAAISELKYRPNLVAKSLVTRRNRTIAYVMVNISDPFHNMVSQGIESVAFRSHYTTMMCDTHSPSRELDYIDLFLNHRLGGVVFHHLAVNQAQAAELAEGGVQCVMMDNEEDLEGVSAVDTDNYLGGAMAAEYLASKGHRRIGCVHGALERPAQGDAASGEIPYEDTFQFRFWRERTQGFLDRMAALGLEPAGMFQGTGRFDFMVRRSEAIVDAVMGMADRPTALYCENDMIAIAMLNELHRRGVRVPEDVALIGHDGLDLCGMVLPNITTIAQPRYEMGLTAAQLLIDQIEGGKPPRKVLLKPTLQVGETA